MLLYMVLIRVAVCRCPFGAGVITHFCMLTYCAADSARGNVVGTSPTTIPGDNDSAMARRRRDCFQPLTRSSTSPGRHMTFETTGDIR